MGREVKFYLKQHEIDWIKKFSQKYNISQALVLFIILVEDKRFLRHRGLDCIGLIRAVIHNRKSYALKEEASTITQQFLVITWKKQTK